MLKNIYIPFYDYLSHDVSVIACSNYMDAFNACKDSLLDGLKYHAQLSRLQEVDTTVRE